jgi:hypothetical protein
MAGVSEGETVCGMILRVHDSMLPVCEYTRDEKKRVVLVGAGPQTDGRRGYSRGQQNKRNKDCWVENATENDNIRHNLE